MRLQVRSTNAVIHEGIIVFGARLCGDVIEGGGVGEGLITIVFGSLYFAIVVVVEFDGRSFIAGLSGIGDRLDMSGVPISCGGLVGLRNWAGSLHDKR